MELSKSKFSSASYDAKMIIGIARSKIYFSFVHYYCCIILYQIHVTRIKGACALNIVDIITTQGANNINTNWVNIMTVVTDVVLYHFGQGLGA